MRVRTAQGTEAFDAVVMACHTDQALALLVIRFLIVAIEVRRIARRLGESGMMGRYFVYDLLSPLWALALSVMLMRSFVSSVET